MTALKSKRNFSRTRTAYSINRTVQPIVSKLLLDMQTDKEATSNNTTKTASQRKALKSADLVLDRLIGKLKKDNKDQDILLMITPASRHANLFKLHVIQRHKQIHLGMITVTEAELSHLKASKASQSCCIIFASLYINLVQTEKIQNLLKCLARDYCSASKETALPQDISFKWSESNASTAGDCRKNEPLKTLEFQSSFIQTEPDEYESTSFSLSDIYTLMDTINRTLQPSKMDIKRFFYIADQLNLSLIARPQLLWKSADVLYTKMVGNENVLVESYLPGSSYLGCITLKNNDLLQIFDLYPHLLLRVHAIEDVFEITPLPQNFVMTLKKVLSFLKLELLYDAVGEFLFDCYKDFTYL